MEKSIHTLEYSILRAELVSIRKNAGLTQRDVAQRLKVPPSWIAKVETGERRLDFIELCKLLSACGVEPLPFLKTALKSFAAVKRRRAED